MVPGDWAEQQPSCLCERKGEGAKGGLGGAHLPLAGPLSPGHLHPRAPLFLQKESDVLMRVGSIHGQTPELTTKQVKTCWAKEILSVSYFLVANVC